MGFAALTPSYALLAMTSVARYRGEQGLALEQRSPITATPWISSIIPGGADQLLARRVQVAIEGLRGMDVRCGPMHNDRLHGLAVTKS